MTLAHCPFNEYREDLSYIVSNRHQADQHSVILWYFLMVSFIICDAGLPFHREILIFLFQSINLEIHSPWNYREYKTELPMGDDLDRNMQMVPKRIKF